MARLSEQAATWRPQLASWPDGPVVAEAIANAAAVGDSWPYHPALASITLPDQRGRAGRELALAGWMAGHAGLDFELTVEEPTWCWSAGGGFLVGPGRHTSGEIGVTMVGDDSAPAIPIDPWCTILGYDHADSWPSSDRSQDEQAAGVRASVLLTFRVCAILGKLLPDVDAWVRSLVKVLVPLAGTGPVVRSSSEAELPGAVFADVLSEVMLLECLVHEGAHHLLSLTEAAGPLVDPTETRTFTSPLRPDPRPLRNVVLAYHALAFMHALYVEVDRTPLGAAIDDADVRDLRAKLAAGAETLDAARGSFTDRGLDFLRRTHEAAGVGP